MKDFYAKAKKLDVLKRMAAPKRKDIKELLKIIKEDEVLEFYFYEENDFGYSTYSRMGQIAC